MSQVTLLRFKMQTGEGVMLATIGWVQGERQKCAAVVHATSRRGRIDSREGVLYLSGICDRAKSEREGSDGCHPGKLHARSGIRDNVLRAPRPAA